LSDARELDVDEARDYVYAALSHLIDVAPNRLLILDREKLRYDGKRMLLIEVTDQSVEFSLDDASVQ
jgi:hypothetical protein